MAESHSRSNWSADNLIRHHAEDACWFESEGRKQGSGTSPSDGLEKRSHSNMSVWVPNGRIKGDGWGNHRETLPPGVA